jgi:hypothetical protein
VEGPAVDVNFRNYHNTIGKACQSPSVGEAIGGRG